MSIWDHLKSVQNFITGGSARIEVIVESPKLRDAFDIHIRVTTGDQAVPAQALYLELQSVETILLEDPRMEGDKKNFQELAKIIPSNRIVIHRERIEVSALMGFKANSEYTFQHSLKLPPDARPCYNGVFARHYWQIYAGLKLIGTDPTSDWVEFEPL